MPLLLFRPLRLCVPSEELRNARIVLLRATHLPYVGAIWTYERASRFWNSRKDDWLYTPGSQKRPLLASHISFSHKAMKYPAHRNRSEASLTARTPGSNGRSNNNKEADTVAELRKVMDKLDSQEELIEKLSKQVETLAWRITPSSSEDQGRLAR